MTKIDIAALRELHAKATPGEWSLDHRTNSDGDKEWCVVSDAPEASDWDWLVATSNLVQSVDAAAIVAAHNALPALLDRIEDLEGALKPFADAAARWDEHADKLKRLGMGRLSPSATTGMGIARVHCDSARAALTQKEPT